MYQTSNKFYLSKILVGFVATTAEEYADAMAFIIDNLERPELVQLQERARCSCRRFSDNIFQAEMTKVLREFIC